MITGRTKLCGLFGYPVRHSLSPLIYNALFERHGLDRVYVPLACEPAVFEGALAAVKRLGFVGLNFTTPFKEAAAEAADRLEGAAAELGCVNTLAEREGSWVGLNTDGEGLCRWLEADLRMEIGGQRVVVLGAGHAARAVLLALAGRGPRRLIVLNRSVERFSERFFRVRMEAGAFEAAALESEEGGDALADATLVVNATSYGLGGREEIGGPLPQTGRISRDCIVVDTNYGGGGTTPFLRGLTGGRQAFDGRGMLIHLAGEAFREWTGVEPDLTPVYGLLGRAGSP